MLASACILFDWLIVKPGTVLELTIVFYCSFAKFISLKVTETDACQENGTGIS